MRVEKIFLMMGEAPLRQNRSTAADNSCATFHSERNVAQQNAGMNREVVDTLFGLFNQRVSIDFPCEFFRTPPAFFQGLVNRNGSDGYWRVPENPFPGFVDVLAGRQIHYGVCPPCNAPTHLLHF